jgi:hypothetical protein
MEQKFDYPCTNPFAPNLAELWSNYSNTSFDGDSNLYLSYVCRFAAYWTLKDFCASTEGYGTLILGTFGLLGSLANVLTLWQRRFRVSDFFLFRVVG